MVKVTYLHYNPFQQPYEQIECLIVKGNDLKKAKRKVLNRLKTVKKRKGINPYRLSTIREVRAVIF